MPKPENVIPYKWKKGQSGNPNGRPRKLVSETIKRLEEDGVHAVSKKEIQEVYLRLINLTMPELTKEVNDSKQSALVRIVGKAILSKKGFDIIEKMLDRSIGKVQQDIGLDLSKATLNMINLGNGVDPNETS